MPAANPGRSMPHSSACNRRPFVALAASFLALALLSISVRALAQPAGRPAQDNVPITPEGAKSSPAVDELEPVVVPVPSELALQFYRTNNWIWIFNFLWAVVLTGSLAFSGLSARLRNLARRLGKNWFFTISLFVVMYLAIVYVIDLPLSYYEGFVRLHAYGLSNQTWQKWLGDSLISLVIEMVVGFALAWVPFLLLARSPRRWWLYMSILSVPFLFVAMLVDPIWIDPLFNRFGPMKNQALEKKILALAGRAGIEGSRVFEVEKSVDTKAINAYVKGVFGTKRIVLYDTLINKLNENELLVVMGHEMGHYVLGHVVRSILLSVILTLTGLFLIDRLGRRIVLRFSGRLGFDKLSDIAALPLLFMLLEVVTLLLSPAGLWYSRMQEHEADQFSLDLTHANHSGGQAFVKIQEENLSNPNPGLLYKLFRASHPSLGERIAFCNTYHPWLESQSAGDSAAGTSSRP
jgi:Zn-dependent protease with chaperone function